MNIHKPQTRQEAHKEALSRDLDAQYNIGEHLDVVILESPGENNGREAFARHKDVSVFIYPCGIPLHTGNLVRIRVSEKGETHLKAVAICQLE